MATIVFEHPYPYRELWPAGKKINNRIIGYIFYGKRKYYIEKLNLI